MAEANPACPLDGDTHAAGRAALGLEAQDHDPGFMYHRDGEWRWEPEAIEHIEQSGWRLAFAIT
jgi:hypothetical protein